MTSATWTAGSGDWSVATNWSDGTSPNDLVTGLTTDVGIALSSAGTVTLAAGESYSANSLTIGSGSTTFDLLGTLAIATSVVATSGVFGLASCHCQGRCPWQFG
jgi:hypothetical protein